MNEQQKKRLIELSGQMRKIAHKVGSLHAYWDIIFDIDAFVDGRPAILKYDAAGWIKYAEKTLKEDGYASQ